jgi:hypothetical protein
MERRDAEAQRRNAENERAECTISLELLSTYQNFRAPSYLGISASLRSILPVPLGDLAV